MMSAWYFYYSQFMRKSENQLTRTPRLPLTSLCLLSDSEHIVCVCVERSVDCAWPAERVCISVQCAHKDTGREKICVETTRV